MWPRFGNRKSQQQGASSSTNWKRIKPNWTIPPDTMAHDYRQAVRYGENQQANCSLKVKPRSAGIVWQQVFASNDCSTGAARDSEGDLARHCVSLARSAILLLPLLRPSFNLSKPSELITSNCFGLSFRYESIIMKTVPAAECTGHGVRRQPISSPGLYTGDRNPEE